jgi:hypothetical protein
MSPVTGLIVTQHELDYMNAAQKRLTAELRSLETRSTITVAANSRTAKLPDDVVRLEGLFYQAKPLRRMTNQQLLQLLDDDGSGTSITDLLMYAIVGRTLYLWPVPTATIALTAFYSRRAADANSGSTFEVSAEAERVLERLTAAYRLMDDGQPELAQAELAGYAQDVARLRNRYTTQHGTNESMRLPGRRRPR